VEIGLVRIGPAREAVAPEALRLPACPLPRPGDVVTWYQNTIRCTGLLLGHTYRSEPCIEPRQGGVTRLASFDDIRIDDRRRAVGPNWLRLPASSTVTRPHDHELEYLERLLDCAAPSGTEHRTLALEIWNRGYEIFLAGATVREALAKRDVRNAEFVTTMPLDRLHPVVVGMYGLGNIALGELGREWGRLRLGGAERVASDAVVEVRVFRHAAPGTNAAVFGASFERDLWFGDLSCNAVYYEPINKVLIDPTGFGLDDATGCCVRGVFQPNERSAEELARIGLRVVKQRLRGYQPAPGCDEQLTMLLSKLPAMPHPVRAAALVAEVFEDLDSGECDGAWIAMRNVFADLGLESLWRRYVEPHHGGLRRE